jgi:O-antigen/teichoic acid export membrane protein
MADGAARAAAPGGGYGRGARILSVGIASTGVFTALYFAVASHVLGPVQAKRIDLVWSLTFVIISIIYRPVEQLLSRTIADARARGHAHPHPRTPLLIQGSFAAIFLALALALRHPLRDHVLDGSSSLYAVLIAAVLAYSASYFARGWLAGHQRFGLYGALAFMESVSRFGFVLAVAVGIASGQAAVALGIAVAPLVSLLVVPLAFARHRAQSATLSAPPPPAIGGPPRVRAAHFALSVAGVMLAEQALLNIAVITVDATAANAALAGIVFNVLLIARAPLQLFQAVQTSLLPHLAGLEATEGHDAFAHAIRMTLLAIGAFAGAVTAGLLLVGPFVMSHVFGQHFHYGRAGLGLMGIGMGLHLASGALNQSALARDQAGRSSAAWLACAALFVAWTLLPVVTDHLLRVEIGYAAATGALATVLLALYRAGGRERAGLVPA